MKMVLNSRELPHAWAHQTQSIGRSPSNTSFDGPAFYSYGTVIARIVTHKAVQAFVIDGASFSNSTSKHQSRVRQAVNGLGNAFYVHCGRRGQSLDFTPESLRDYYVIEFNAERTAATSRYAHVRAIEVLRRSESLATALEVCKHFALTTAKIERLQAKFLPVATEARKVAIAHEAKLRDRREKQAEANRIQREAYEAEQAKQDAEKIAEWIRGGNVEPRHCWPVFLRVEDGIECEMVTTKGARVPIGEAERAYRFAMAARARGWHRNGSTFKVGNYDLDAVNEVGVIAGCHRVTWNEIERFAAVMGWNTVA